MTSRTVAFTGLVLGFVILVGCGGEEAPFESTDSGVTVTDGTVSRVTIRSKAEFANTPIPVGREITLDADAFNKAGVNISLGTGFGGGGQAVAMKWNSSNAKVASIAQGGRYGNSGVLKALSPGQSTIRVEASGASDSVVVTVR